MKKTTLKASSKLMTRLMNLQFIMLITVPAILYYYFNYSSKSFYDIDNYYKIITTEGSESGSRMTPSYRPITNLETTKEWLRASLIDLMTYDAISFSKEERFNKAKEIIAPSAFNFFWRKNMAEINADIDNGYLRTAAITSFKPVLLGKGIARDGLTVWKFYLKIEIKKESKFENYPRYLTKDVIVIVKELDPSKNFKGIGILNIEM